MVTTQGIACRLFRGADPLGLRAIKRDHLANVASLEHERWKRAHPSDPVRAAEAREGAPDARQAATGLRIA